MDDIADALERPHAAGALRDRHVSAIARILETPPTTTLSLIITRNGAATSSSSSMSGGPPLWPKPRTRPVRERALIRTGVVGPRQRLAMNSSTCGKAWMNASAIARTSEMVSRSPGSRSIHKMRADVPRTPTRVLLEAAVAVVAAGMVGRRSSGAAFTFTTPCPKGESAHHGGPN
jgi:hypothetical protein